MLSMERAEVERLEKARDELEREVEEQERMLERMRKIDKVQLLKMIGKGSIQLLIAATWSTKDAEGRQVFAVHIYIFFYLLWFY